MTQVKESKYTAQQIVEVHKLDQLGKSIVDIHTITGVPKHSVYYITKQVVRNLRKHSYPASMSVSWREAMNEIRNGKRVDAPVETSIQEPVKEEAQEATVETQTATETAPEKVSENKDAVEVLDQAFEGMKYAIVDVVKSEVQKRTEHTIALMKQAMERAQQKHEDEVKRLTEQHAEELRKKDQEIEELNKLITNKKSTSLKGLMGGILK